MKSLPILIALAFVGVGATFAIAHAPERNEAHEDANEQAETHACPPANATALEHANEHARFWRCDANATAPWVGHRHDGGANETDDDNETDENETDAADDAADHPAPRDHPAPNEHADARGEDDD